MKNKSGKQNLIKRIAMFLTAATLAIFGVKKADNLIGEAQNPVQTVAKEASSTGNNTMVSKKSTSNQNMPIIEPTIIPTATPTPTPTPTPELPESPFKKYQLTDQQLTGLAAVAYSEAGTRRGAATVASIMANMAEHKYLDENTGEIVYNGKTGGDALFDIVKDEPWFQDVQDYIDTGHLAYWCDNGRPVTEKEKLVVYNVLNGLRTVRGGVDEFDSWDKKDFIAYDKNGEIITNYRDLYIPGETVIKNNYDASYIFYGWVDPTNNESDPCGILHPDNLEPYGDFCYSYSVAFEIAKLEPNKSNYVIATIEKQNDTTTEKKPSSPRTEGPQDIFER